mgnify:CR=1 FL=1
MAVKKKKTTAKRKTAVKTVSSAGVAPHVHNSFEWGVILAGTMVALALSMVLIQFGALVGFNSGEALRNAEDMITPWGLVAVAIWFLWIQVFSSGIGGYLAGWLRTPHGVSLSKHQREMRDGFHGLTVWATSTVAVFTAMGVMSMFVAEVDTSTAAEVVDAAVQNAETNATILFAFAAGATSLVSAVVAWWAATKGGEHRDGNTNFSKELSF